MNAINFDEFPPLNTNTLSNLQREAEAAGKRCVVGALITNQNNEIFVQKRSLSNRLFPGCWDIAGGHVEPGESLLEALTREVTEETGWELLRLTRLIDIFDWETARDGQIFSKESSIF